MLARSTSPKMTVDQFLTMYDGVEGKYELVDGRVYAMTGGSMFHSLIAVNIVAALRPMLRGTGGTPFNSEMGLKLDDETLRYPDAAIYCDPRDLENDGLKTRLLRYPSVVFEVLSPSTRVEDRVVKVLEYKSIETVEAIVLIDPVAETIEVHERLDDGKWLHCPPEAGIDLILTKPPLTIARAVIFDFT